MAGCVQAWMKSMLELLDDSAHEDWAEAVLDKTKVGRLWLFLEVSGSDKASTSWSAQRNGFTIGLPKKQIFQPAELFPVFRGELLTSFEPEKKRPEKSQLPIIQPTADEWMDAVTGRPADAVENPKSAASRPSVEYLPNALSLPRPDELFLKPPYHLTMVSGHSEIEIQGSHSPSLKVLADYFQRWCRINHHDTTEPACVQVVLHQSAFGLGEMFDRLTLSTKETRYSNQFQVTSPMVVAMIEGVLGYELVSTYGSWTFRRDAEFKTM